MWSVLLRTSMWRACGQNLPVQDGLHRTAVVRMSSTMKFILEAAEQQDVRGILHSLKGEARFDALHLEVAIHSVAKVLKAHRHTSSSLQKQSLLHFREPLLMGIDGFRPQAVARTAWALATLRCEDREVLSRLSSGTVRHAQHFQSLHISNIIWAFAKLRRYDSNCLSSLTCEITTRAQAKQFSPQSVSIILWGYTALSVQDDCMFRHLSEAAIRLARKFNGQDISNTLWAFCSHAGPNHASNPLFLAMASAAQQSATALRPNDLTNIVWAFAESHDLRCAARHCRYSSSVKVFERIG